jgi:hypothetical protein
VNGIQIAGLHWNQMPAQIVNRTLAKATRSVPGLRRIPVLKLLAIAEVAMLARDHLTRLDQHERRRLVELVRLGRGRKRNLTPREREELGDLVAKTELRLFVGSAADKLSPVPIPPRLFQGPRKKRP